MAKVPRMVPGTQTLIYFIAKKFIMFATSTEIIQQSSIPILPNQPLTQSFAPILEGYQVTKSRLNWKSHRRCRNCNDRRSFPWNSWVLSLSCWIDQATYCRKGLLLPLLRSRLAWCLSGEQVINALSVLMQDMFNMVPIRETPMQREV